MAKRKRILIIDDHPLFREGINSIIRDDENYEVLGQSGSGNEGLKLALKLKPDIIISDISLPELNGIQITQEIKKQEPEIKVLILSMHTKIDYILKAFRAGASGYLVKDSAGDSLINALETILKGEFFVDQSISKETLVRLLASPTEEDRIIDPAYETLTAREKEILKHLAEGLSVKEISVKLFISAKTAENHRASIMKKLNIHSPLELVKYAIKVGLINLEN